jgi:cell division septal protein FtsQ
MFLIPQNHYLFMNRGRVDKIVTAAIADVREVTKTTRHWPNGIDIEISERKPGFALIVKGKSFIVDEEGTVMEQAVAADLPQVVDELEDDIVVGEILPNPKATAFIVSMAKNWTTKIDSPVVGIKIPGKASTEVQFTSADGWSAFFDINRPVLVQLSSLALILSKQIAPKDRAKLAYIDLRSDKWVYYCFKATPCSVEPVNSESTTNAPK